jgi:hypothetical protein
MLRHAIQKLEAWTVEQQQEIAERKEREQQHEEQ